MGYLLLYIWSQALFTGHSAMSGSNPTILTLISNPNPNLRCYWFSNSKADAPRWRGHWMGAELASNPKVLLQSPVWEILLLL